jgi:hypothetical protein
MAEKVAQANKGTPGFLSHPLEMTYEHLVFIVKCDAILDDNDTATTRVYAPDLLMSGGNQEVGYLYCLYINDITKQRLDTDLGQKKRKKGKLRLDF